MIPIRRFFVLVLLPLLFLSTSSAQKAKKLEISWLAKDLKAIELIPTLLQTNNQTFEIVQATLGENTSAEEEVLGFGARRIEFSKGNGYTSLSVNLFLLNGTVEDYKIAIRGSSDSWPQIRRYIVDTWRKNGGPKFTETEDGLSYRRFVDSDLEAYKKAVAMGLGEMRVVRVPPALKDYYEYLISPRENSVVGNDACDIAGVTPIGKQAIDALMKAHRTDLVENVLKGYNPGGRVYAALALLAIEKQGSPLNVDARTTIEKIRILDIIIETCSGCIHFDQTAKEIFESPQQL